MKSMNKALLATAIVGGLLQACAQQVGDIDRTNPNRIEKEAFSGEWYFRQTVVDINSTGFTTFTALQGEMERVKFDITEDYLIARRTYEDLIGSDTASINLLENVEWDGGQPVAAFMIQSHFDIQRQYNSATGEQSNVISENSSDRDWNEREWIRVDWTRNAVATSVDSIVETQNVAAIAISPQDSTSEPTWFVERDADGNAVYIDVLSTFVVEPSWIDCVLTYGYPASGGDCGPETVTVRSSFVKIVEESDHQARTYTDWDLNRFGFFRTERCVMDRQYGCRDSTRVELANIWNIWDNDTDGNGNVLPYAERTTDPIAYYINADFPIDLVDEAYEVAEQWDAAFRRAVAGAQGVDVASVERMFYLCLNPGTTDPVVPAEYRDQTYNPRDLELLDAAFAASAEGYQNGECARAGEHKNFGDLRYSFMNWVNNHNGNMFWSGYGPSSADPLSGEILNGNANINGDWSDNYARRVLDVLRVVSPDGDLDPLDLAYGNQVAAYFENLREQLAAEQQSNLFLGYDSAYDQEWGSPTQKSTVPQFAPDFDAFASERLEIRERAEHYEGLRRTMERTLSNPRTVAALSRPLSDFERRSQFQSEPLRVLEGTPIEQQLIFPEMEAAFGQRLTMNPNGVDVSEEQMLDATSPVRMASLAAYNRRTASIQRSLLARNIHLSADFDPYQIGFAQQMYEYRAFLQEQGLEGDELDFEMWKEIRGRMFRAVLEHEVGHTIGLRHNFEASYDALNYQPQYWSLRQKTFNEDCDEEGYRTFDFDGMHTGVLAPARCSGQTGAQREEESAQVLREMRLGVVDEDTRFPGGYTRFQYASTMDYDRRPDTSNSGIGLYDYAAIAYGYTGLVEVFNQAPHRIAVEERLTDDGGLGSISVTRDDSRVSDMRDIENYTTYFASVPYGDEPIDTDMSNPTGREDDKEWTAWHYSVLPIMFYDEAAAVDTTDVAAAYSSDYIDFDGIGAMAAMYDRSLMPLEQAQQNGELIVPYRFCSDEYSGGSTTCRTGDLGADEFEALDALWAGYEAQYITAFFRGDRAAWGLDIYPLFERMVGQFTTMNQYFQFAIINYSSNGFGWLNAENGGTAQYLAGIDALNHLGEVITTPTVGTYGFDAAQGMFVNLTDDFGYRVDSYKEEYEDYEAGPYVDIGIEDGGRFGFSEFLRDEEGERAYYGLYHFQRLSHFYAKYAALIAFTSGDVDVVGADTDSDASAYFLPAYLIFPDEVTNFMGAVIGEDFRDIGWCVNEEENAQGDMEMVASPQLMMDTAEEDTCTADGGMLLNPYPSVYGNRDFNARLLATTFAAGYFQGSLDMDWLDNSSVYIYGRGEQPEIFTEEGEEPEFEWLTFTDELGMTYAAKQRVGYDPSNLDAAYVNVGADMVQKMIDLQVELDAACPFEAVATPSFDVETKCGMTRAEAQEYVDANDEPVRDYYTVYYDLDGHRETVRFLTQVNSVYQNYGSAWY